MLEAATTQAAITTGIKEISEAMGGGIRQGSLVVIEGESKTGKSVLSQHLAHGTLRSKEHSVVYYTAESNLEDLLEQMCSMSLDVRQDFATDRLRIYSIGTDSPRNTQEYFQLLINHFNSLPQRFRLVIVDSVTPLLSETNPMINLDFFQACKELCHTGRSIVLVVGTHLLGSKTLARVYAMSDYYLRLRSKNVMIGMGQVDERKMKIMEVTKLRGAERHGCDGINFEIKSHIGIQILPFVTVKA